MKNISLKKTVIIGAVFMIIGGSLMHFAYEWSGNNQLVAVVSAVSESVWEHNKLFLLPLAIVAVFEYMKVRDLSKILWVVLVQLLFMICFVAMSFYTYTGALGFENPIVDISLFVIAVIIGQIFAYKQLTSRSKTLINKYFSAAALLMIFLAFAVITFYPPRLPIFTEHSQVTKQ